MIKLKKPARCAVALMALLIVTGQVAKADTAYQTYSINAQEEYVYTQTAYTPVGTIEKIGDYTLSACADMTVYNNEIYICDTGNKRILIGDLQGNFRRLIEGDFLQKPTGLFVVNENEIYIADQQAKTVFVVNAQGEVLREYTRPTEVLFGASSQYEPLKVAADSKENVFIVSKGNTNGVIQLSRDTGEFMAYYGANAVTVSLWDRISNVLFTEEQKNQMKKKVPPSPNNITIDKKGIVYTITDILNSEVMRKLNVSGQSMFTHHFEFSNPVDLECGQIDNIYVATKDGFILEFGSDGRLLFLFGGLDDGTHRIGLFQSISSLCLDNTGNLYVMDDAKNEIQIFEPTDFADQVHTGLDLYQQGKYEASKPYWENVLSMNALFDYANLGMGEVYYKEGNYSEAMAAFRLSGGYQGYSKAFEKERNDWIRDYFPWLALTIFLLICLNWLASSRRKKHRAISPAASRSWVGRPLIQELMYMARVPRNPAAAYYGIKWEKKVSVLSASLLYLWLILLYLIEKYFSGFLFKAVNSQYDYAGDIFNITLLLLLVIVCHYLICSITDGEASIKNVYCGLIYACAPYLLFKPWVILLTHVLTYNEAFLVTLLNVLIYAGCAVLVIVMIREMNNYTYKETFKNIFLTAFALFIALAVLFIVYTLGSQLIQFIMEVANEVVYRVQ